MNNSKVIRINPFLDGIAVIGRGFLTILSLIGGVGILLYETFFWLFIAPITGKFPDRRSIEKQLINEGINSIPIVTLLSFTVGLILAMQTSYNLEKLGASTYFPARLSAN